MRFNLEFVENEMAGDQLVPGRLADYRVFLAALYSLRASEMQKILGEKPRVWLSFRQDATSAAEADRMWETTEGGQREIQLRWELRRIDKLSSAAGSKLRIMEAEARNQV
jgi:hypothetical protein